MIQSCRKLQLGNVREATGSSSSDEMMSDFENSFFLTILNNLILWHYFQNPHRDEILL